MTGSQNNAFNWWVSLFSVLTLTTAPICWGAGKILFEEDFEAKKINKGVWLPSPTWKIIDGTLDILGGGEGYTLKNDFTDFEFSADFLIVAGYNAFLMRVQDAGNLYGHMVGADDPIMWWHSKEGGVWAAVEKKIEKAPIPKRSGMHPVISPSGELQQANTLGQNSVRLLCPHILTDMQPTIQTDKIL